jgi:transcriptional regulator with GAF, ATPase, and Fis domain
MADGGSILLDEIGELPLDLQAKLLRVLQEGEYERLGSTVTRKVDVRVIAATNRNLEQMVADGTFREDLFYRLNVFPLSVPPLRKRGSDVAQLARVFAERFAVLLGRHVDPLTVDDHLRLEAYQWPGNVRELQNVVERAIILSTGSRIEIAKALPASTQGAGSVIRDLSPHSQPSVLNRVDMLAFERDNIIRALDASGWTISGDRGAAHLLDLPPSTLSSRMKALEIVKPG